MGRVKLNITGLTYSHSQTEAYALILAEEDSDRRLPIIIGKSEAQAIAIYLEHLESPRPLTHDLIKVITETLQGEVIEVDITKLVAGVFYAEICLVKDTHVFKIDARVSDAVAVALRFDAPIYCAEEVMQMASFIMEEHAQEMQDGENDEPTSSDTKSFSDYTQKQLEMMMNEAVKEENYERAARLKKEIEKRQESND
ncbi:hypothetical protein C7377_0480 [Balneicella halophila]|uniref:BFN domain-containing protein n=1 Tax=Balneicella halophila TaxID=1537566 RepID=A0A7L4USH3_BALHA|nr:bifunctional nuclease family protein [Balneicella halophila]PVX52177.1 hypothetical protein C7377_0480 [Balneicella halophila]